LLIYIQATAIELDPDFSGAYFNRGLVYRNAGDLEQAIANFEQYLELAPNALDREEVIATIEQLKSELGP
jgi:tetratricopeptide (TPR) repeat protein